MAVDYKELGVKIGLEWHQQRQGKKLFCNCSTNLIEQDLQAEIKRKLRATAGELGSVDAAVAYEQLRDKEFTYQLFKEEGCLVDLDEEPPHPINQDHLQETLALAQLLKLTIPDTIFIMRKIVTDGSACSSFQRTAIGGLEGKDSYIHTSKGDVKINQLNLEEDSCKIVKREDGTTIYSLSRQGIPLWEVGTDASIKDADHALEVAKHLGMIFRSFKGVKRGLGSIRQDINVSIKGGERIEVKGWQDLKTLPLLIDNEVTRQKSLLDLKEHLLKHKIEIKEQPVEVTSIFKQTQSKLLVNLLQQGGVVYALKLPSFSGLLKKEICAGKTFGKELAEYAMAFGTKGMIHTDEDLTKYQLTEEFNQLRTKLNAKEQDLVLIVAEKEPIAKKAVNAVLERAKQFSKDIPKETRIPNHHNATSSFARPLPGAGRMYPESDLYPILITKELLKQIILPELLDDKLKRIATKYQLNQDLVKEALKEWELEDYLKKYATLKPTLILSVLVETPKEIKTRFELDISLLEEKHFDQVLTALAAGKVQKEAVQDLLIEFIKEGKIDLNKYAGVSQQETEAIVKKIVQDNKGAPFNALMGECMKQLKGKVDSKKIVELIKKYQ